MDEICIFPIGNTLACQIAGEKLSREGIFMADHPRPEVTHLLLDVPSFLPSGRLRGGGDIGAVLEMLPEDICIIGGKLNHPALEGYNKLDLLRNERYLAINAAITADCALSIAAPLLNAAFRETPTLILGWGRIGKCLGQMLKALGTPVTIAARKERDRGMLEALGYEAVDFQAAEALLPTCKLLINTVPQQVLEAQPPDSCIQIDLASFPGLFGENVIWAKGLPGTCAPESAGRLMADTILKELEAVR